MKTVSIVIPAFNEETTLGSLLQKIKSTQTEKIGFKKEIIVVDDGSSDKTFEMAKNTPDIVALTQINQGKGAAVKHGIAKSSGDHILIQDADLEYDPADYIPMLQKLSKQTEPTVIYGSRILGQKLAFPGLFSTGRHPKQGVAPWLVNRFLTLWIGFLFRKWITDPLTGYKLYPSEILKQIQITTAGFETDHEITAKLLRKNIPILEVPVTYCPRTVAEGKKIKARDGLIAFWTILKFRLTE